MKILTKFLFITFTGLLIVSCEPEKLPESKIIKKNVYVGDDSGDQERPVDDKD